MQSKLMLSDLKQRIMLPAHKLKAPLMPLRMSKADTLMHVNGIAFMHYQKFKTTRAWVKLSF